VSKWPVVAIVCWSLNFGTVRAGIIIVAPTISLPYSAANRTEIAEVYVLDSNDPSPPEIGADQIELALPDTSSVLFTGAGATTVHPYLYGAQTPGFSILDGGNVVLGSDFGSTTPTLANNDGLLLVDFTIAGGTSGVFPLTLEAYEPSNLVGTALFDQNNILIPLSMQAGEIEIAPAVSGVPEPSTALLSLLAILGAGFATWTKRRLRLNQRLARH
jgi:hypothetical protein